MLGILFALGALICWTIGDFFIQRTSRMLGIWKALFFVSLFGMIALYPFISNDLPQVMTEERKILLLTLAGVVTVFAALFNFEALKEGKFAIVEPIFGIELPITVGLSVYFLNEALSLAQIFFISMIFMGIVLAITIHIKHLHYHKRILEKGVILAGIGSVGMALTNFLTGVSSQEISPLMTLWFVNVILTIVCLLYIIMQGKVETLVQDIRKHTKAILAVCIFDNLAWIFYAYAMTLIPISIATAISESYIAGGVLLGLVINKEKVKKHQLFGIILTIVGVIVLAAITQG